MASPSVPAHTATQSPSRHGAVVDWSILERALPPDALQLLRDNTTVPQLPLLCVSRFNLACEYGIDDADAVFRKCVNEFILFRLESAPDTRLSFLKALPRRVTDLVDTLSISRANLPLRRGPDQCGRDHIDILICEWVVLINLIWIKPTQTCQDFMPAWIMGVLSKQLYFSCGLARNERRRDYYLNRRIPASGEAGDQRKEYSD